MAIPDAADLSDGLGGTLCLTGQRYLFVSFYRAFAESSASENASRLVAMQSAEKILTIALRN